MAPRKTLSLAGVRQKAVLPPKPADAAPTPLPAAHPDEVVRRPPVEPADPYELAPAVEQTDQGDQFVLPTVPPRTQRDITRPASAQAPLPPAAPAARKPRKMSPRAVRRLLEETYYTEKPWGKQLSFKILPKEFADLKMLLLQADGTTNQDFLRYVMLEGMKRVRTMLETGQAEPDDEDDEG